MVVVLLVLAIGMATAGGSAQEATEQPTQKLSKKKFKTLIANARTPEEHVHSHPGTEQMPHVSTRNKENAKGKLKNTSRIRADIRFRSGRPTDSIAKTWRLTSKRKRGRNSPSLTYMN
jgi:hypothetical protein